MTNSVEKIDTLNELMKKREHLTNVLQLVREALPFQEGQTYHSEVRYAEELARQLVEINRKIKELQ